jgi:hypothetical protein
LTTTATITTQHQQHQHQQNTSTLPTEQHLQKSTTPPRAFQDSSESFIRNEKEAQAAPQPAPRTRLSSQNSFPMTNGSKSSDEAAQVRYGFSHAYELCKFLNASWPSGC